MLGDTWNSQPIGSQFISNFRIVGTTDAADAAAAGMHGPVLEFQMT